MHFTGSKQQGFTAIEILLVLGIGFVVGTLAKPSFQYLQAKAYQAEAKTMLRHISMLETAYEAENGGFSGPDGPGTSGPLTDFENYNFGLDNLGPKGGQCVIPNAIGFQIQDCSTVRYNYYLSTDANGSSFNASSKERTFGEAGQKRRAVFIGCEAHVLDCSIGGEACLKKDSLDQWMLADNGKLYQSQNSEGGCSPMSGSGKTTLGLLESLWKK